MSTAYRCFPELPWAKIWEKLPEGVREEIVTPEPPDGTGTREKSRCLTDGTSFIWATTGDGTDTYFDRYGIQSTLDDLIEKIESHYGVELVDEYDPRFWEGYEEVEEDGPAS